MVLNLIYKKGDIIMKKNISKLFVVLLVVSLAVSMFASCSNNSNSGSSSSNASIKGEVQEHGYFKLLVPEGYSLKHEDVFGDNNPDNFSINNDKNTFDYFYFNLYDLDAVNNSIESTKSINEGVSDVSVDIGEKTWKGIAYISLDIPCFCLYAEFDGNYVYVTGAGNEYNSEVVTSVLASLEVNVTK